MSNKNNPSPEIDQPDQSGPQIKPHITSSGELLSGSIQVYRDKFKQFINFVGIIILAYIPMAIIFGIFYMSSEKGAVDMGLNIVLGALAVLAVIFFIYLSVSSQIGTIFVAAGTQDKKFKEIFSQSRKLFWPFLVVSILTGVFVLLWSILFIIPGIIFAVYYSFSTYTLLFENQHSIQAIKRSKELIKGYWWAIVGRSLFIGLVYLVVMLIISAPLMFIDEKSVSYQIWNIITNLINLAIAPIYIIYQYKIFKDLQQIKGEVKDI